MKLSIIIPNFNSKIVDKTITSILNQKTDYWFEIIIVGVDDFGLIEENIKVKFINTKSKCPPARARNIGANAAKGDYLVFIDSDCISPPFWLEELMKYFHEEEIIAIGGGVKFPEFNYWTLADNISMFYSFMTSNPRRYVKKLPSLNLVVKKNAFSYIQGFDEKFLYPSGEDFDLTMRLSYIGNLLFNPDAWITHHPPRSSFRALVKHSYIQGKYSTKIYMKNNNYFLNIIYKPLFLFIFSPWLALMVTLKIIFNKNFIQYFYLFPAIYISKFIWCFGAISSPWQES